jgi:hypothetical protein
MRGDGKMAKDSILQSTQLAIRDLHRAVKNLTFTDLYKYIGLQLQIIYKINSHLHESLFDYILNEASFDELYEAEKLSSNYNNWIFSTLKPETASELLESYKFHECERTILAFHAMNVKSLTDFWFTLLEADLYRQVGLWAGITISAISAKRSKKDWFVYNNIGQFKKIMFMEYFGCPTIPDKKISEIFPKVKAARNIPLPDKITKKDTRFDHFNRTDIATGYDRAATYIEEMFKYARSLDPKEALQQLFEGQLHGYTKHRAKSRLKDVIKKSYAKKRGGLNLDFSMDTSFSNEDNVFEGFSIEDLDPFCNFQEQLDYDDKIEVKEIISNLFPKDAIEKKIIEFCSQGKNPTNKQISELPGINLSERGVGKVRERIRKSLESHLKK